MLFLKKENGLKVLTLVNTERSARKCSLMGRARRSLSGDSIQ